MIALEVSVNGQRACLAGVGADGSLDALLTWISSAGDEPHFFLRVGGYDVRGDEHLHWKTPSIGLGSEVQIRIVDVEMSDAPDERVRYDQTTCVEEYRQLIRECGMRHTPGERLRLLQELIAEIETE